MKKNQKRAGYSMDEVDKIMKAYIQESTDRLMRNIKVAWKKNAKLKKVQYVKR